MLHPPGQRIITRESITMTYNGDLIYYVTLHEADMTATLGGVFFLDDVFYSWHSAQWTAGSSSTGQILDEKYAVLLSPDNSAVITFTTTWENDCRMDIFLNEETSPHFSKGERSVQ